MDQQTARTLAQLNSEFYRTVANSFSATRQAPWHGWITLADILQEAAWPATSEVDYPSLTGALSDQTIVLDAACGNLRFESFLQSRFPRTCFEFHALDNCDSLLPQADRRVASLVFHKCDLMAALLAFREADSQKQASTKQVPQQQPCTRYTHDQELSDSQYRKGEPSIAQTPEQALFGAIPLSGLVVSFGFMHHVPALKIGLLFCERSYRLLSRAVMWRYRYGVSWKMRVWLVKHTHRGLLPRKLLRIVGSIHPRLKKATFFWDGKISTMYGATAIIFLMKKRACLLMPLQAKGV